MPNLMSEVIKSFGVECHELFSIKTPYNTPVVSEHGEEQFYFTLYGLYDNKGIACPSILCDLLNGSLRIELLPFKPKFSDKYWYINSKGGSESALYSDETVDIILYKLGNCYRTCEEAEVNRDKWVAFYKSDEVLEVQHD